MINFTIFDKIKYDKRDDINIRDEVICVTKERFKVVVAVHLFLIKDDEVLMLRRYNTGYEDGKYSVIAGHIDGNETYFNAMIRETKEEVGITIKPKDLKAVQVMHRRKFEEERLDYFFISHKWDGNISNKEPNKCDDLRWFKIKELPRNTIPYIKAAINNYLVEKKFTDFGWNYQKI